MKNLIWIAALLALVLGCSGKSDSPPVATFSNGGNDAVTTGGRKSTGGYSGTSVGGGGTAGSNAGGSTGATGGLGGTAVPPSVSITSPLAVATPDTGPVLVDPSVDVLCSVTPGSAGLNPVTITLTDGTGNVTTATNVSNPSPNIYTANFTLASSGPVRFTCSVTDKSSSALSASDSVSTFVDHGPAITITKPAKNAAVSGIAILDVSFTVTPVALTTSGVDTGKDVSQVVLTINGVPIPVTQDPNDSTLYAPTNNVSLGDTSLFQQQLPDSVAVSVTATNKRSQPAPVTSSTTAYIYPDSNGPLINVQQPVTGTVIGGPTLLRFTVTDGTNGSGVDPTSITFEYADRQPMFSVGDATWGLAQGVYNYTFDATVLDPLGQTVQAQLKIQAKDKVGNTSSYTWHVYLDDQAPFVSLDPPACRVTRPGTGGLNCSAPFDPVGSKAISNLDSTYPTSYVRVRALVMERTNNNGGDALFYAHMDRGSAKVYASDSSVPLLVGSTPGTGPCIVNPVTQKSGISYALTMVPIANSGSNSPDCSGASVAFATGSPALPNPTACVVGSPATDALCSKTSDMNYVMQQYYDKTESAIYATDVANDSTSTLCAGYQLDLLGPGVGLQEGWVCLAAQASDNVNNIGVSAPIAICLNKSGTANCTAASRPTCTDGCTPASRSYDGDDSSGNPLPFVFPYSTY